MVTSTGARHVEEVAFAVIDLFEIRIVRDVLNALLRGNDIVIARHYCDDTKLKPFRQVHCADRELARSDLNLLTEFDGRNTG
jgi:hypothetical protein